MMQLIEVENENDIMRSEKDTEMEGNEFYQLRVKDEDAILLDLSTDFAGVRTREDLQSVVRLKLRALFSTFGFVISAINEDKTTHCAFLIDHEEQGKQYPGFQEARSRSYAIDDGFFNKVMDASVPVVFNLKASSKLASAPLYIKFWESIGLKHIIGIKLEINNDPIGCVWISSEGDPNTRFMKGLCTQLAIALFNVQANERIAKRELEKSILLSFSNDVAAVRNKQDLSKAINKSLKGLSLIKEYVMRVINEDGKTARLYLWDETNPINNDPDFQKLAKIDIPINDHVFKKVLNSDSPEFFDLDEVIQKPDVPAYIKYFKKIGINSIIGTALRSGDQNLGVIWIDPDNIDNGLLKSICSQISIAIYNILANEKIAHQLEQINTYKNQLEQENLYLHEQIHHNHNYSEIIGSGAEMQKVFSLMSQVAFANSTVLILGETGTGKELIARAIHNNSPRRDKLMVKVNCAALPASLIESELFGHEKGSFTGATERRLGKFELANNGTLFLDEIGEMPLELQVKLLRALQEKEIERVGGKSTIKVDVRIIAATNRNLESEVKNGKFRSDLFYRLNVFPMVMPPLRSRLEDIPDLANFFMLRFAKYSGKKMVGISQTAMQDLMAYHWPGNVRELEHLIERSVLLSHGTTLKEIHLPVFERKEPENAKTGEEYIKTIDENERDHIIAVLKLCKGKIFGYKGAAEMLGVPASTLNSKISKLGIKKEQLFLNAKDK